MFREGLGVGEDLSVQEGESYMGCVQGREEYVQRGHTMGEGRFWFLGRGLFLQEREDYMYREEMGHVFWNRIPYSCKERLHVH